MGGYTILKAVWISFVVSSGALLLNAAIHIGSLDCPPASKRLMVGKKLELQWNYVVEEKAQRQWTISLYVFNNTSNAKEKISTLLNPNTLLNRTSLPPRYRRIKFHLSYDKAYISIQAATFDDTASYGILFEPVESSNNTRSFEKVTDVTIVDLFLIPKESSTILRTWIGQPVTFVCAIDLRDGADSPSFSWKNVRKNLTITENVSKARYKSELILKPLNKDDFGSYKCYAWTSHTKIKHNMTLLEIDYPGYPFLLKFAPEGPLSWKANTTDIKEQKSFFVVQFLQQKLKKWMNVNTTLELSMSLYSLSKFIPHYAGLNCIVRVCTERKDDQNNITCSKNLEVKSEISPGPSLCLISSNSSKKITLTWERQKADNAPVLGYVIQMFPPSKFGEPDYSSFHLKYEKRRESYTVENLDVARKFVFRVCIRNTLCIFEQSCSKKVGLSPVFPSKPRKVDFQFYNNSVSKGKLSWKAPLETGKGILFYVVQVQKDGKGKWKKEIETKYFHTTLTSLSLRDRIRVCARNDIDPEKISCSDFRDLSNEKTELPRESNRSSHSGAGIFIIFLAIIIPIYAMVSMQS
ncbi:titin-like isoform X2 [Dendronephthya gigantea]|uniref:titin-like isoform X2 n=1 Tax=Dendronephthya gigantea TaxID=151771 RepID=UPI00106BC5FD|nr:titin-like isoform X2 [Dendronephthya gigantea]